MLAIVFAFALATTYAAELPSYINVCGRNNPDINKCVEDNILNMRDKICDGLIELNIPKPEPLNISLLVLSDGDNSKINVNDVQITGLCNYLIDAVVIDLEKLNFKIDATFKHIHLNGTYDIDVRILVPLAYKSPIYLTADNVKVKATLQAATANVKGKKHMYVSEMKTNIFIDGYDAQYGLKDEEISQLGQIIGGFIGSNQREFIERLTPPLEEAVAKWLVTVFNNLFKTFSYDELFPDRT